METTNWHSQPVSCQRLYIVILSTLENNRFYFKDEEAETRRRQGSDWQVWDLNMGLFDSVLYALNLCLSKKNGWLL